MKAKFFRKGHIIREFISESEFTDHVCLMNKQPSINAAKRKSREIQAANGGMGNGSLRVVEKLPESITADSHN